MRRTEWNRRSSANSGLRNGMSKEGKRTTGFGILSLSFPAIPVFPVVLKFPVVCDMEAHNA